MIKRGSVFCSPCHAGSQVVNECMTKLSAMPSLTYFIFLTGITLNCGIEHSNKHETRIAKITHQSLSRMQ